jgi:hypothetical protein
MTIEDNTPVDETPQVAEVPASLAGVDAEKLAALKEKLKKFTARAEEQPVEAAPTEEETKAPVNEGKDVDWSEYDLDFNVRHLYPQAKFRMTPQGPKWVVLVDEFLSTTRNFGSHGKTVKALKGDGEEPLNMGEYLGNLLNSPEGWRLVSVLPMSGGQAGIMLQRAVPVVLPDPVPLKKETEVEAPVDAELKTVEDAALDFMRTEGIDEPILMEEEVEGARDAEHSTESFDPVESPGMTDLMVAPESIPDQEV